MSQTLNLASEGIQEWPYSLFSTHSHVSAIILRQNRLPDVDSRIAMCNAVTIMDLSHNNISSLCPEIGRVTTLQRLSLSFNKLAASSLPHTLSFLVNLREIKLDSNALDCVPLALQQTSLTSLSRISLQSNCIRALDAELCHLKELASLSLEGNPLEFSADLVRQGVGALQDSVRHLLTNQNISWSNLESLPWKSVRLLSLHSLDASHNPIATLNPDDSWGCHYLQVLSLASCAVSTIGHGLLLLQHLHTLHLNSNMLTSSSLDHLCLLHALTDLDVSANAMVSLPPSITGMTYLHSLRIRSMGLYELPPTLAQFSSLTRLDIGDNRLQIAAPDFIYKCTLLADLRMDTNNFYVIHDSLTQLKGLKVLHCQHTRVSSFPIGLHQLTRLEELRAHHCRLQTIDGRIGLLPYLHVIDCSSNPTWSPSAECLSLETPELKRVLAALAHTQPAHAVASHIMFRNRKCQLLSVDWDGASGRMEATVRDVSTGQVFSRVNALALK